jgi:hypothetical protein
MAAAAGFQRSLVKGPCLGFAAGLKREVHMGQRKRKDSFLTQQD